MIVVVGLSHKSAPIEVRERLAIPRDGLVDVLAKLVSLGAIGEAVLLSTCNRVEVYAAPKPGVKELDQVAGAVAGVLASVGGDGVRAHLGQAQGPDAVRHLFRVASSLDSLVVGEPQILGQLREAIEVARGAKTLGPTLGKAMHRAVRVGRRVRSETAIGEGQVSVSSVAVDLARDIFGELGGHAALLVGAGEMAEAAAKLVVRAGARLSVVNRSAERGAELAGEVGGTPHPWTDLERCLVETDIVITSTSSPHPVVSMELAKRVQKARRGKSLFLIDIAVPRDVDPRVNQLDNVFLYDVDDLSKVVAESLEGRAAEAERAETIVAAEAGGFEQWTAERALAPAIVGLRARTRAVLAAEVERSLAGKLRHLSGADREALAMMINAATNKLLHLPVTKLKAMASDPRGAEYVETLRELFDLPDVADETENEAEAEKPAAQPEASGSRAAAPERPAAQPEASGSRAAAPEPALRASKGQLQ